MDHIQPYFETTFANSLLFALICLLFSIVAAFAYIKLRYPFWNLQPVYHVYDFWRSFYSEPFIIRTGSPTNTKFCDFTHIRTFDYADLTDKQITHAVELLQCHHIKDEESGIYAFNADNFNAYMSGHIYPSFISFYLDVDYFESAASRLLTPYACMTSRSIIIQVSGKIYNTYYWDFIVCHRNIKNHHRIIRNLIQTHNYRTTIKHPDVSIALFRKNNASAAADSCGIVPVCEYRQWMYRIKWPCKSCPLLPKYFIVVDVGRGNINDFFQFMDETMETSFAAISNIGNLCELVVRGILYIYLLTSRGKVYGSYIFRDSRTSINPLHNMTEGPLLILSASICSADISPDVFYAGFLHAKHMVLSAHSQYRWLLIEGLGCNIQISKLCNPPDMEMGSAYYLYNFVCQKVAPEKAFILL